ncbi:hypothetical protein ABK040_009079 [Willaertia magna]
MPSSSKSTTKSQTSSTRNSLNNHNVTNNNNNNNNMSNNNNSKIQTNNSSLLSVSSIKSNNNTNSTRASLSSLNNLNNNNNNNSSASLNNASSISSLSLTTTTITNNNNNSLLHSTQEKQQQQYYIHFVNQCLSQYTTIPKRIKHLKEISPSLFIILYEAISGENEFIKINYPKFIRERKLTLKQNEYNVRALISYLRKEFKEMKELQNIDSNKLLERNEGEIVKMVDWLVHLEKLINSFIDPNLEKQLFTKQYNYSHKKKFLNIKKEKLKREEELFLKSKFIEKKSKQENLLKLYYKKLINLEKEKILVDTHDFKRKEKEMTNKYKEREDSIHNFYKDQILMLKEKLNEFEEQNKLILQQAKKEYYKKERELYEKKELNLKKKKMKWLAEQEKKELRLMESIRDLM